MYLVSTDEELDVDIKIKAVYVTEVDSRIVFPRA